MANLQIIKDLVKERGMTLESLANELSITPQALSKIIRVNSTKIETLEDIARILKVSVSAFFENTEKDRIITSACADNQGIAINGFKNNVNSQADKFLNLLSKKDEQMDRLLGIIENMNK